MPQIRYSRQIKGKRQTVVTGAELKGSAKSIGKALGEPNKVSIAYGKGVVGSIVSFLSVIGDFIQGRHRQEVIDWENRVLLIDTETPEEKYERNRCKTFDFLNPYLEKIERRKEMRDDWGDDK